VSRKRILVIDDDADWRIITAAVLQYAGYEVIEAPDGSSGVELAQVLKPDLIIMDLQMPYMHGLDAIRLLKSHQTLRAIPVIGVTAHDFNSSEVKEIGFETFFNKPLAPEVLWRTVDQLIGGPTP
jgi:CheY-like chemotaxis protein